MRLQLPLILMSVAVGAACHHGPTLDTRSFELKYLSGGEASLIVNPYVYADRPGGHGLMSYSGRVLTVRETPDNLDRIARVLAQYDRAHPLVRLTFHLIQADGATATDSELNDVEPTLRKLFRFKGYRLVEEGIFSATEGGTVRQSMGSYTLETEIRHVAGAGDSATIDLSVHLAGRDVRFGTDVGVAAGKTAVLGNIGEDPRGTLILTVRSELVNASP